MLLSHIRAEAPRPVRTDRHGRITMDDIGRAIEITEAIVTLPPVPTHDWCDRAGAALSLVHPGATAMVAVAYVDAEGRIAEVESVGGARSESPTWPALTGNVLRRACQRLTDAARLGFQPAFGAIGVDLLSDLGGEGGPLATIISPIPDDPAVCMGPLSGSLAAIRPELSPALSPELAPDLASEFPPEFAPEALTAGDFARVILALVAGSDAWPTSATSLLRATFPGLARRASRVLEQTHEGRTPWLTDREQLILQMIAEGRTVQEMAERIDRSPFTVNDHVKVLHKKLGTSSRGELMARAFGQPELFSA